MGWKGRIGKGGEGTGKGRGENGRGGREVRGRKEKEWPPLLGQLYAPVPRLSPVYSILLTDPQIGLMTRLSSPSRDMHPHEATTVYRNGFRRRVACINRDKPQRVKITYTTKKSLHHGQCISH